MKTIGIKLADGSFFPVLEEDTPAEKTLELTTAHNNQTKIMVDLYRSKSCTMEDAEYVDSLQIENLNAHPNGEPTISFCVSIDEDNKLSAAIKDPETGKESDTTITLVSRTLEERLVTDEYDISDSNLNEKEDDGSDLAKAAIPVAAGAGLLSAAASMADDKTEEQEEAPLDTEMPEDLPDFDETLEDIQTDDISTDESTEVDSDMLNAADSINFEDDIPDEPEEEAIPEDTVSETELEEPVIEEAVPEDTSADVELEEPVVEEAPFEAQEASLDDIDLSSLDVQEPEQTETPSSVDEFDLPDFEETSEENTSDESVPAEDNISEESTDDLPDFSDISDEPAATEENAENIDSFENVNDLPDSTDDLPDFSDISDEPDSTDDLPDSTDDLPDFSDISDETETTETEENIDSTIVADASDTIPDEETASTEVNFEDDIPDEPEVTDIPDAEDNVVDDDLDFDLPDFEEKEEETPPEMPDDFFNDDSFDSSSDMSAAQAGNISFTGLYDKETEMGVSGSHEDDVKKKTKTPVIICIVCAIICIIATILILFVIPSKYNLINKSKKEQTVVEQKAEKKNKKQKTEEVIELTPEPEPVPEAKEDEVVIIEKAEEVVPEQPEVKEEKIENTSYKIRWGDTLWDIADTYYKNPWRYKYIARYNGISNPDHIISGTYIIIPAE